jgi:hypothetical protein
MSRWLSSLHTRINHHDFNIDDHLKEQTHRLPELNGFDYPLNNSY